MMKTIHMVDAPCLVASVEINLFKFKIPSNILMKNVEIFACANDVNRLFVAVLQDMGKNEFMNLTIKRAKSTKCQVKGCKKVGIYKLLLQYFPQVSNKTLQ